MSDLISRQDALDAFGLSEKTRKYGGDHSGYDTRMLYEIQDVLEGLPSAQPDNRLERIADIVEGTIDHLDRDDAIDMLYQIKEVLK